MWCIPVLFLRVITTDTMWGSVAVLCLTALQLGCASQQEEIAVTIDVSYSKPSDFSLDPPNYRAGSSITLTCKVEGVEDSLTYSWSSTCTHNCFVKGRTTQNVTRNGLYSVDSGTHTCNVTDALGCTGNASIDMNVMGVGIYANSAHKVLTNNSIIKADSNQRLGEFSCLSGSTQGGVGQFIGRDGRDITYQFGDPFYISIGPVQNPGFIQVSSFTTFHTRYQGVYTCRIPDETGKFVGINVGLYSYDFNTVPHVTAMERNISSSLSTLTCTSTGSPPTTVTWTKDGETLITNGTTYSLTQTLVDRVTSTYNNTLTIEASFSDIIGEYSCKVANSIGTSNLQETEIKAVEIRGHEKPFIVGLMGDINCSTHLNSTSMEWFLVGVDDSLEKSHNQHLTLTIDAETTGLDGAMFTCRVTDVEGNKYEESITVRVKELENIVTIEAAQSTMFAGASYTLNCTVVSDFRPVVKWMGLDGDPVNTNPASNESDVTMDEPVYYGNKTCVSLRFYALRTSQAGQYTCQSIVSSPLSVRTATKDVIVTIPVPSVHIVRTPSTVVYTTTLLNLTCIAVLNPEVDNPMTATHLWRGPSGNISSYSSHPRVYNVTQVGQVYRSTILFSSGTRSSDSGTYYCIASTSSASSSPYIASSDSVSVSTSISIALQVVIDISYTPPEPGYQPPYYRAASPVTLTCRAVGGTGRIRYRWTSTCHRSYCFVPYAGSYEYSYGAVTRSRGDFLRIRDAGTHTCSAYEESHGISGSASTVMNVIGAGIHVTNSELSYSSSSLPNNSIITADGTRYSYYSTRRRMGFYCCSSSTSAGTYGTFIGLNSIAYSGRIINRRSSSSSSTAGCMNLYFDKRYRTSQNYLETYEQGIYTCRMPDATGRNTDVSVGIYREGYNAAPTIASFQRVQSTTYFTLTCTSTNSPATTVTWMKDGDILPLDGVKNQFYQTVTSRRSSTYQNTLVVDDTIENLTGNYTCNVNNKFGSSSQRLTVRDLQITAQSPIIVSNNASIVCSSDLDVTTIEWIRDNITVVNSSSQPLTLLLDPVSVDHNTQYTCRVTSPYGTQEETVDITVQIPQSWATVHITSPPDDRAVVGREFIMTCTVTAVEGLTVVPSVTWTDPDGNLTDVENITMGPAQTFDLVTSRSLTLHHLQSPEGGQYSCNAAISVPGFEMPPQRSAYKQLVVISQALFQLKIGPVEHCVHWEPAESHATTLDSVVREALAAAIRERCSCDFQSTSIEKGEFSCQTTTTHVIYRSIINGTSDVQTAPELLDFIEDWLKNEGTFLTGSFRLRAVSDCPLQIQSFHEPECMNGESTNKQNSKVIGQCLDQCVTSTCAESCDHKN